MKSELFRPLWLLCLTALALSPLLQAADSTSWLNNKYDVKQVLGGGRIAVDFNGLNLVVKLVGLQIDNEDKALAEMKKHLDGKKVVIVPEELAGISADGLQQVYAFIGEGDKRVFINEVLIVKEVAKFVDGPSLKFKKFMDKLREAGLRHQPPEKKVENVQVAGFCSELNSKKYHLTSCKWAKMMNEQNRILYDSMTAAEKAEKSPCPQCLFSRVKDLRLEQSRQAEENSDRLEAGNAGPRGGELTGCLFGLKSDEFFYSPVSKALAKADQGDLVRFNSLKEARESLRKPDVGSLRIDNPVVPGPKGKECIGRALPYMRPCRRETDHPTGLCEPCLNGRIR